MNIKGKEICNITNNLITLMCSSGYVKLCVGMRDWWPNYIVLRRWVVFFLAYIFRTTASCAMGNAVNVKLH